MTIERQDPLTRLKTTAISDVSFAVARSEAVALIGDNGAGKSTILLAAAGLTRAKQGSIFLDGEDVGRMARSDPRRLRRSVGVALQFPERSFFQTTVREEIGFTARCLRLPPAQREDGLRRALSLAGLEGGIMDRSPFEMSGGQKRRVALAAAVAHGPSLVLLDEPEAGLDLVGAGRVRDFIARFASEGGSLVAATHDVAWALSWATRCLMVDGGRLLGEIDVRNASGQEIADALGDRLPDGGALGRIWSSARGAPLPPPYRDEVAFLARIKERLGEPTS